MFLNKTNLAMLFSLIAISACSSNEIGESKDVAQDKIYQRYNVRYNEGNDNVAVHAKFRFAGSNGTTLVLSKPSQLAFDNEVIKVDSSGEGAYYELMKPVANFYGKHHFVFTDINNKKFDNDFSFDMFRLLNPPATASKKQALRLSFESVALSAGDYIEALSSGADSSWSVRTEAGNGNAITIPVKDLMSQKQSELKLDITLYKRMNLQQSTGEGGSIEITYALKPLKVKLVE